MESLMLVGWCSTESSATCSIYCQRWEWPASVPTAKMGSSIFPLCLTLLLCSVYGSPVSVSKTWFLQAPLSPKASHTLYWLYSVFSRWETSQVKLVSAVWAGLSFEAFSSTCCELPHPNTLCFDCLADAGAGEVFKDIPEINLGEFMPKFSWGLKTCEHHSEFSVL